VVFNIYFATLRLPFPLSKYVLFCVAGLQPVWSVPIAMWYFFLCVCVLKLIRNAATENADSKITVSKLAARQKKGSLVPCLHENRLS